MGAIDRPTRDEQPAPENPDRRSQFCNWLTRIRDSCCGLQHVVSTRLGRWMLTCIFLTVLFTVIYMLSNRKVAQNDPCTQHRQLAGDPKKFRNRFLGALVKETNKVFPAWDYRKEKTHNGFYCEHFVLVFWRQWKTFWKKEIETIMAGENAFTNAIIGPTLQHKYTRRLEEFVKTIHNHVEKMGRAQKRLAPAIKEDFTRRCVHCKRPGNYSRSSCKHLYFCKQCHEDPTGPQLLPTCPTEQCGKRVVKKMLTVKQSCCCSPCNNPPTYVIVSCKHPFCEGHRKDIEECPVEGCGQGNKNVSETKPYNL